jgi:hypothetical protein
MIGDHIISTLERLNLPCRAAIMIRHSERPHIASAVGNHDVALTPAGIEAAARLGHTLSSRYKHIRLFHSPVLRCAQTAQSICEGAGPAGASATVHGPRNCLGGSYLLDPTAALPLADELGSKFVRTWFSGGLPPAIIKSLAESLAEHTEYILAELGAPQAPASIDVHVTHDWNLMVLREGIFGIRYEEVGWPDYLDGIVFHEAEGRIVASYHDADRNHPAIRDAMVIP